MSISRAALDRKAREKRGRCSKRAQRLTSRKRAPAWLCLAARPNGSFCRAREFPPRIRRCGLDREETDIQAALQAALAQIGEERQGKILLISDGNENRGEISRIIPLCVRHGLRSGPFP